ncbi:hypothetical protein PFICI_07832 [Pestalotiopsis fici W106-1]|uniref:AMP-dependent synthetase/ligase domain-containing protein n=1 Tax=Pestalotiopsis fici (strain W106-1 / CGMCC3.15140) TaxID=1229662 RepID=W3X2E5_PESFW|nr:uncharacterized protein PFICI_07832 [Pestalotiopsis fici W106-1]ETS80303.1 hypothetical protein PFICI_07832 [Pestalotiopsis fici W106-1]
MTVNDIAPPAIWSTIVDTRAAETPSRVFCEILEADWRDRGPREITYAQFARAVNRACWWLENEFGAAKDFDAFTYVGDNDLRYTIIMIAAQKSERTMVIAELSRLTHEALLKLLETTKCFRWLGGSEDQTALGKKLIDERPGTQLYTLPPLEHWLDASDVPNYPFTKTWEEAKPHPAFVIHSSGTTGIPKPLRHTLESVSTNDMIHRYPDGSVENPENGFSPMRGSRMIWAAPPQWMGGIWGHLFAPLFYDGIPVWPPVDHGALSPVPVVMEMLEKVQPDGAFFVPSMARDLCQQPAALARIKQLQFLVYGGAPLDGWVGDLLCTELRLVVGVGSTECGLWPLRTLADPRDWRYYHLDPRLGYRLDHYQDDMYEVVLERRPEYRRHQGVFVMFPDLDVWHTNDLYSPHPTKPGLLRYRGRKDDLVKLVWLTKVRAGDMESALVRDPRISNAMVGGEGKPTPFVILQLSEDVRNFDEEDIWNIVRTLNEKHSAEVHLPRQNILVAAKDKPLRRLGKGTLDRRGILADYGHEISKLYDV